MEGPGGGVGRRREVPGPKKQDMSNKFRRAAPLAKVFGVEFAKVWAQNGLIRKSRLGQKWSDLERAKSGAGHMSYGPKPVRAKSGTGQKWSGQKWSLSGRSGEGGSWFGRGGSGEAVRGREAPGEDKQPRSTAWHAWVLENWQPPEVPQPTKMGHNHEILRQATNIWGTTTKVCTIALAKVDLAKVALAKV